MDKHPFLFHRGKWVGEGKISFSASPEELKFYTRWTFPEDPSKGDDKAIYCTQHVEMMGDQEHIYNHFTFFHFKDDSFEVELENELIGRVQGVGVADEKKIAWEFRGHPNFEGFEAYQAQKSGDYSFHAEYVSPDQFRSIIDGRLWKKEATSAD